MDREQVLALLSNPQTSAQVLYQLAIDHPFAHPYIAAHPNAYDGLIQWLGSLDNAQTKAVVAARGRGLIGADALAAAGLGAGGAVGAVGAEDVTAAGLQTEAAPVGEATGDSVVEPEPVAEPVVEPIDEPVAEAVIEPVTEPIGEPVVEPVVELGDELGDEPAVAASGEAVAEPVTEPVNEPVTEPVTEPATEPVFEPVAEPKLTEAQFLEANAQPEVDGAATTVIPPAIPPAGQEPGVAATTPAPASAPDQTQVIPGQRRSVMPRMEQAAYGNGIDPYGVGPGMHAAGYGAGAGAAVRMGEGYSSSYAMSNPNPASPNPAAGQIPPEMIYGSGAYPQAPQPERGKGLLITLIVLLVLAVITLVAVSIFAFGSWSAANSPNTGPTQVVTAAEKTPETSTPAATPEPSATPSPSPSPSATAVRYPAPAGAIQTASLVSPSENIFCDLSNGEATCTVVEQKYPESGLPNCGPQPFTIATNKGVVELQCGKTVAPKLPILDYGKSAVNGNVACTSYQDGMSCWNTETGAAFKVARAKWSSGTSGPIR